MRFITWFWRAPLHSAAELIRDATMLFLLLVVMVAAGAAFGLGGFALLRSGRRQARPED